MAPVILCKMKPMALSPQEVDVWLNKRRREKRSQRKRRHRTRDKLLVLALLVCSVRWLVAAATENLGWLGHLLLAVGGTVLTSLTVRRLVPSATSETPTDEGKGGPERE